jgi:hypothetical protein
MLSHYAEELAGSEMNIEWILETLVMGTGMIFPSVRWAKRSNANANKLSQYIRYSG